MRPLPENSNIKIKKGFVLREDETVKGMGSSEGGDWQPSKDDDKRLVGKPGDIIESMTPGKNSYRRQTKIGADGKAEFKSYRGVKIMSEKDNIYITNSELQFKTISEFKWCLNHGGELQFDYNEKSFGIFSKLKKTEKSPEQILFCRTNTNNSEEFDCWVDTIDEVLECEIDGKKLNEIITQVEVTDRPFN